jgi:3-phenylpropionate/trans-cinnamate dioxygenase ferredoxin reductase subunit
MEIDGNVAARDCTVTYHRGDRKQAVLTIQRDLDSLRAELAFEKMSAL